METRHIDFNDEAILVQDGCGCLNLFSLCLEVIDLSVHGYSTHSAEYLTKVGFKNVTLSRLFIYILHILRMIRAL